MEEKSSAKPATVVYTEEQIRSVLKRVEELDNLRNASDEAGIPWQKVAQWRKKAGAGSSAAEIAEAEKAKLEKEADKSDKRAKKTAAKSGKPAVHKPAKDAITDKKGRSTGKNTRKKTADKTAEKSAAARASVEKAPQEEENLNPILLENAVLKEEVKTLKEQVTKLKKALSDLI